MQDRYAGDIGDFGKYGLLRMLAAPPLSLGIVWYRIPDALRGTDGQRTGYLDAPVRFRACDPPLFDALRDMVQNGRRSVSEVLSRDLLPTLSCSDDRFLTSPTGRDPWLSDAQDATAGCDLVFLDPDNGLAPSSVRIGQNASIKYAFLADLVPFLARGQSLCLYHHLSRRKKAPDQIATLFHRVRDLSPTPPFALRFHRGGSRVFLLLPAPAHRGLLVERARRMVTLTPWSEHFSLWE
jgi:hypothetical protein